MSQIAKCIAAQRRFGASIFSVSFRSTLAARFSFMAPAVQVKFVHSGTYASPIFRSVVQNTENWSGAGPLGSQRMLKMIGSKAEQPDDIMLSFEPMITFKYTLKERVQTPRGQGIVLQCHSAWLLLIARFFIMALAIFYMQLLVVYYLLSVV